jgi:DNA-binding transcriptional regulator GbsR (MarR family)
LHLFSDKFKNSYSELCKESLRKYINKSKKEIIQHILEQNDKWDVYSLSILYLHILGNISRVFSLKQPFISKIVIELTKNINPEPSKRMSLDELKEIYYTLFNEEKDWSFVNKLQNDKMKLLFENLEK